MSHAFKTNIISKNEVSNVKNEVSDGENEVSEVKMTSQHKTKSKAKVTSSRQQYGEEGEERNTRLINPNE